MKAAIQQLRRRLALALWPSINTAHGKRLLEKVAHESGASITQSKRIAAAYFESLKSD